MAALAVQGINSTFDNNAGKTFGASAGFIPPKDMSLYLGYMGGREQPDVVTRVTTDSVTLAQSSKTVDDSTANSRWRHLVDVIGELEQDKIHLLFNADFRTERMNAASATNTWYGANLTLGYALTEMFALAARGGYTADAKGNFRSSTLHSPLR